MKFALAAVALLAIGIGVTARIDSSTESAPKRAAEWKYLVVRCPKGSITHEVNVLGAPKPLTAASPLDQLGTKGWELVSVVQENDGSFIAWMKQPK